MAAPTLAQYQDRNFPRLSQELILDLTRSSPIMRVLPMIAVDASGAQWNPVNALGGVARTTGAYTTVAAGAQTATTTTKKNRTLVTWYGDVHMDQIQANNMREVSNQIVGKSVAIGRDFNEQFIEGDGSANNMTGLDSDESIPVGQQIGSAGTLKTFDLPMMDALARRINGRMDAYILHSDHISTLEEKLRQANGASLMGIREMPDPTNGSDETVEFQTYRGKLLIYNNHIAKTTVGGKESAPIYAVRFDSGRMKDGLACLTWTGMSGIYNEFLGSSQTNVGKLWRVLMHANLAVFESKSCSKYHAVGFE